MSILQRVPFWRALRNWSERLDAEISGLRSDVARLTSELQQVPNLIMQLSTASGNRLNSFENEYFVLLKKLAVEVPNRLIHVDSSLTSRLNSDIPTIWQAVDQAAAIGLRAIASRIDRSRWVVQPDERYTPAHSVPMNAAVARARDEFPQVYSSWLHRLDEIRVAFDQTIKGNAAHGGDLYSRLFKDFLEINIFGRVLDVGCGVFGRPYYLQSYGADLISGIDPLPMKERPDFELVQGISEYLPWPDQSFSTVVSATALDHCLSLEKSLDEMTRVLSADGKILLWLGSVPGSPQFEPTKPGFEPADRFHLFHFDVAWFEPMLESRLRIVDKLEFMRPGYSHVFYCLQRRFSSVCAPN